MTTQGIGWHLKKTSSLIAFGKKRYPIVTLCKKKETTLSGSHSDDTPLLLLRAQHLLASFAVSQSVKRSVRSFETVHSLSIEGPCRPSVQCIYALSRFDCYPLVAAYLERTRREERDCLPEIAIKNRGRSLKQQCLPHEEVAYQSSIAGSPLKNPL